MNPASPAPSLLDKPLLRRRLSKAAASFDQVDALDREVARRMGERLDYIKLNPKTVLDLGCGTGADLNFLGERYPTAQRIACDLIPAMLGQAETRTRWFQRLLPFGSKRPQLLCADAEHLPLSTHSMGLVWSNLMLHWLQPPLPALLEMHRVLEVGGLLMFTTLGPDTLKELRQTLGEAPPSVHRFLDMHDIGDMLVAAGFAEPVMDMEYLTLTYPNVEALLRDLRLRGGNNAHQERRRGLMGRRHWQQAMTTLADKMREGRLPISIEVVYGHAWKAAPRTLADGRAIIQFDPGRKRSL